MFSPDAEGIVRKTGRIEGYHAIENGQIDMRRGLLGFDNTWGIEWAESGKCFIPMEDAEALFNEDGQISIPVIRN
jgi:hypothetical protein